ncbi:VOC family protein [Egicoccus sp. AB-alg2]|uniref:VOC family protein n=1 Tax=Egicoccus sp. AB-alg2 TaxID=3242693 RepID=UPI00359D6570
MTVQLTPYLNFRDRTREVMTYYQKVFGGELTMDTFASFGASEDSAEAEKIMHSQLETEHGLVLMAADVPDSMDLDEGSAFNISLSGDDDEALRRFWDGLCDGGTVVMPLEPAPWGDTFGHCVDRFGVRWLVNIAGSPS